MFTSSFDEAEQLQGLGWKYEGAPWFGKDKGTQVFRMYNPSNGDHFWTASSEERENLKKVGWKYEGVAFNV